MQKRPSILLLLLLLLACDSTSEDCSTVLCVGPPVLVFEVLSNGSNVFDEGMFTHEDVDLIGQNLEAVVISVRESNFRNETTNLLYLEDIDWQLGLNTFTLNIDETFSFELNVEIELSTGPCCGGIPIIASYQVGGMLQENPNSVVTLDLD